MDRKSKKRVLVTGGAGYIGSHTIVELIKSGYQVESIDNFSNSSPKVFEQIFRLNGKRITNYNINLCDYEKLPKIFKGKKFDAIIHFAAFKAVGESMEEPLKYYENNMGSLFGAIEIAKFSGASSFIYSSSAAIYDLHTKPPYTENSKLLPLSPYGFTKKIGEEILENYTKNNSKTKSLSLRYFNPAGAHPSLFLGENPKEFPSNLVPAITRSTINKKPFYVFGDDYKTRDGTCIRDYIHVSDVARAHVLALDFLSKKQNHFYDVINIGTGKGVSIMEVIYAFKNANRIDPSFLVKNRRDGDLPVVFADTKKAKKMLKFKPEYSIFDIMKTAWEWEKKRNS